MDTQDEHSNRVLIKRLRMHADAAPARTGVLAQDLRAAADALELSEDFMDFMESAPPKRK